jgi:hypothetical protein
MLENGGESQPSSARGVIPLFKRKTDPFQLP